MLVHMTLEREPAVLRELFRDLHWNKKQSLHQIAKNLGIGRRTLIRLMRKLGVPTRSYRDAIALVSTTGWITADLLKDLYWKKKLSGSQIAEQLGVSAGWIGKLMAKYGIPARTISEAGLKYPKRQFSGNSTEASYILGLRAGDLHGRIYGLQVRLSTSSTHPAMWCLFNAVFGGYTRVGKSASFSNGQYGWSIYCDLDRSFVFLQSKRSSITADVLNDEDKFLSFFAAYTDSEGSFRIYPADGVTFLIQNKLARRTNPSADQDETEIYALSCLLLFGRKTRSSWTQEVSKGFVGFRDVQKGRDCRIASTPPLGLRRKDPLD